MTIKMRQREGYRPEQIRNEAFAYVDLGESQKKVLSVIEKWQPISNESIAKHLGVYPHQVTPRVLELRELGYVKFYAEGRSERSGKKVSLWVINPDGKQLELGI